MRRLDHAGLLPAGSDAARQAMPQEEVAALLEHAAAADSALRAYLRKFREEFPSDSATGAAQLNARLGAEYQLDQNHALAGIGYDTVWSGARFAADENEPHAVARGSVGASFFAAAAALSNDELTELQAVLAGSRVGVWAGRREVGYGAGTSGTIVLDHAVLDGGGFFLTRPWVVPVAGAIRFETHLARIGNVLNLNGTQRETHPWFWTARAAFEPHARLRIGVNRGMMFGGEGNIPVSAERLFKNLIGIYTSDEENSFANQLISVDIRYAAPTRWPLALYAEWGADDGYGGWWHVPAIIAGLEVSALPAHDVSIGIERTEFTRNTTTNSLWYQNAWFRGSWADDGELLGHPLAGHGIEWRVFAAGGSGAAGFSAEIGAYVRRRRDQNLFAPQRHGSSFGGTLNGDARLSRRLRLVLSAEAEHGTGDGSWNAAALRGGIHYLF